MEQFARQEVIPGWDQEAIRRARVLVAGRGWAGCFTAWGLISLGVGEMLWLGASQTDTDRFEQFLLTEHAAGLDTLVGDYMVDARTSKDLQWICPDEPLQMMIVAGPESLRGLLSAQALRSKTPLLSVGSLEITPDSGAEPAGGPRLADHPIPAMVAAALAIDEFRQAVNPLELFREREWGHFELPAEQPAHKHPA